MRFSAGLLNSDARLHERSERPCSCFGMRHFGLSLNIRLKTQKFDFRNASICADRKFCGGEIPK